MFDLAIEQHTFPTVYRQVLNPAIPKKADSYKPLDQRVLSIFPPLYRVEMGAWYSILAPWFHSNLHPAIHGGVTAAFLEVTAIVELSWAMIWEDMEAGKFTDDAPRIQFPKTIDFTVDYLRSGLPRDAYARARVNRSGRRYASVHVETWQDNRSKLFASATGHFLMPQRDG